MKAAPRPLWAMAFRVKRAERIAAGFAAPDFSLMRERIQFELGRAQGQLEGQAMMVSQLERILDERHSVDMIVTPEDVARAKRGMVH